MRGCYMAGADGPVLTRRVGLGGGRGPARTAEPREPTEKNADGQDGAMRCGGSPQMRAIVGRGGRPLASNIASNMSGIEDKQTRSRTPALFPLAAPSRRASHTAAPAVIWFCAVRLGSLGRSTYPRGDGVF